MRNTRATFNTCARSFELSQCPLIFLVEVNKAGTKSFFSPNKFEGNEHILHQDLHSIIVVKKASFFITIQGISTQNVISSV